MPKTAQQKMNEFFNEADATRATMKAFADASRENYGSHAYAAGYFESMVVTLTLQLPKAKRDEVRREFEQLATKQRNEVLLKTIKEAQ
jgi:quinol monooxygenase YgiN